MRRRVRGLKRNPAGNNRYTPNIVLKASATTGSITSGTNTLTVASASGFAQGDQIIVEIGAEPGLGLRNSVGVGGTWPAQSYTQAQIDAVTPHASGANNFAYISDGLNIGKLMFWSGSVWSTVTEYYRTHKLPRSLVTTISSIAGNVLTLGANASATATNANVYLDNRPLMVARIQQGVALEDVIFPVGHFYFSGNIQTDTYFFSGDNKRIAGQGMDHTILQIPKGCDGMAFKFNGGEQNGNYEGTVWSDFHLIGNFGDNYWLPELNGPNGIGQTQLLAGGLNLVAVNNAYVQRVRATNFASQHFRCQYSDNIVFSNCEAIRTVYDQFYLQWTFQVVDSANITVNDLIISNDQIVKSVNSFDSTNTVFNRLYVRNGLIANNSSTGLVITDLEMVIEADSYVTAVQTPISVNELRCMDMNSNIAQVGGSPQHLDPGSGALIGIKSIEIEGFVAAGRPFGLINCSGGGDVWVYGNYDPTVADDGNRKGLVSGPWLAASTSAKGTLVDTISPRTKVSGLRITSHAIDGSEAQGSLNAIVSYGTFTTTSSDINALGTGTGTITVANAAKFDGIGFLMVGTERMAYEKVSDTSLTITGRAQAGTTAATHANGATVTYLDTPIFIDNIIENITVTGSGVALKTIFGNIPNAAYDTL